jgi:hydroxymethylbilane synthase
MLRGQVLAPDGSASVADILSGPAADAARIGAELGRSLRARAPAGVYT